MSGVRAVCAAAGGAFTEDEIAAVFDRAGERQALSLAGSSITQEQIKRLHGMAASDHQAFADTWRAWAFVLVLLPLMRLAFEAIEAAQRDDTRFRGLVKAEREAYKRMARCVARNPKLQADFSTVAKPEAQPRGRRNETDLRDHMIELVRDLYPEHGRAGKKLSYAMEVARMLGCYVPALEDLRRDMRRRAKSVTQPQSRAFVYYCLSVQRGGYSRILREAVDATRAAPLR